MAENQKMTKKENIIQMVKFALISASAGIIQFGSYTLLHELIHWEAMGVSADSAHMFSYLPSLILSVIWNFTINRKFTFKSANNVPIAMIKVAVFYCIFTPLSTWWGKELVALNINNYIVEIGTMLVNLVTEYLWDRFIVFRGSMNTRDDKKETAETNEETENVTEEE